jgi:hypothetical protein
LENRISEHRTLVDTVDVGWKEGAKKGKIVFREYSQI